MQLSDIRTRVMNRLNLTSPEAATRINAEINDRYREVVTSVNLTRTRRSLIAMNTASGQSTITTAGVAKLLDVFDPVILRRPLNEVSQNQIRLMDASSQVVGTPYMYAIEKHQNDTVTIRLFPQPTGVSQLQADCVVSGTDLVNDTDIPTFPNDYHDVLVHGVLADEYAKLEKTQPLAEREEAKFEKRLSELRYFLIKSAYLSTVQKDHALRFGLSSRVWPYANIGS
jgi:hypothetical protein